MLERVWPSHSALLTARSFVPQTPGSSIPLRWSCPYSGPCLRHPATLPPSWRRGRRGGASPLALWMSWVFCRARCWGFITSKLTRRGICWRQQLTAPACQRGGADAVWGADALAEGRVDLAEGGSLRPLLLPAVEHQLMEVRGAVHRSREPEAIFNGLDHLRRPTQEEKRAIRRG